MINLQAPKRYVTLPAILFMAALLNGCDRSEPSAAQIQAYIENYQIAHDYSVAEINYEIEPKQRGESGAIRVSGKLELREPLYAEDIGNKAFRKNVAKMLRRNRFSEREINHEIYDRVIRVAARVPNSDNEYHTFLKQEHAPGYAINFSADLIYKKGNDGFMLDGPVRHPKLLGARLIKFANPVVDDSALVEKAVKGALAEQVRYREMMKESSALLSRLWDNDFGLVVWGRKAPYLGNENLSVKERAQLAEFTDWRGVYRISNIKPVQYRTPHASNFFELGAYTTEGVATCLRPTGFIDELEFSKSGFDQYCEFGKQYPARIQLASVLSDTNEFDVLVNFEVNGVSSGAMRHDSLHFRREDNEVGRYSKYQKVVVLDRPFDIKAHNRPVFNLVDSADDQLYLEYFGATDYELAGFDAIKTSVEDGEPKIAIDDEQIVNAIGVDTVAVNSSNPDSTSLAEKDSTDAEPVPSQVADSTEQTSSEINTEASKPLAAEQASVSRANDVVPDTSTEVVDNSDTAVTNAVSQPLTKKELVKAIQIELKRLKVYDSYVDGIAGENTFKSMTYVEKQLGKGRFTKPSQNFLSVLTATPVTAITPPEKPFSHVARKSKENKQQTKKPTTKNKDTVAGKAIKGTGRAINNAARWAGGLFRAKDSGKKASSKNGDNKKKKPKE